MMANIVKVKDVKQYKPRLPTLSRDFIELFRLQTDLKVYLKKLVEVLCLPLIK